jgi:hypothetical protein
VPPRYAFWTILIDQTPTAFRAREQEELLPTLAQLRRTNKDVVLRWFSQGRLWDSPEQEKEVRTRPAVVPERRNREWRPGGAHKDPRARFQKKRGAGRPDRAGGPRKRGGPPKRGPRR